MVEILLNALTAIRSVQPKDFKTFEGTTRPPQFQQQRVLNLAY